MRKPLAAALLAALVGVSATALAASGDPEAGFKKSTPCQACHGPKGISVKSIWPSLMWRDRWSRVLRVSASTKPKTFW